VVNEVPIFSLFALAATFLPHIIAHLPASPAPRGGRNHGRPRPTQGRPQKDSDFVMRINAAIQSFYLGLNLGPTAVATDIMAWGRAN
jgi:hypothetical protein